MSSIESLKEKARRHEQREEWQRALELYSKAIDHLARDDQPDIGLYNRLGDIQTRIGNLEEAARAYEQAIDLYVDSELPNNAIAVCKKVIRNMPFRDDVYLRMGQIRAAQGFLVDARANFLTYAERRQEAGEIDEALRALVEFADLAPEDLEIRLAVAEQLQHRERSDDALEQLVAGYRVAVELGQDEMIPAFEERIREVDPGADPEGLLLAGDAGVGATVGFEPDQVALDGGSDGDGIDAALEDFDLPDLEAEEEDAAAAPETGPSAPDAFGGQEEESFDASDAAVGGMESLPGLEPTSLEPTPAEPQAELEADALDELPLLGDADEPDALEAQDDVADLDLPGLEEAEAVDLGTDVRGPAELDAPDSDAPDEADEADDLDALDVMGELDELEAADGLEGPDEQEGPDERQGPDEVPETAGLEDAGKPEEPGQEAVAAAMEEARSAQRHPTDSEAIQDPATLEEEGRRLEVEGDRDRAVQRLDEARVGFDAAGDLGGALRATRMLVELQPDGLHHHQRFVELAFRDNDDETLAEAYLGLAGALERQGDREQALGVYQQILSVDPGNEAARAAVEGGGATATSVQEVASSEDYVDLGGLILDDDEEKTTRFKVAYEEPSGDEQADFRRMLSQFKRKVAENLGTDDVKAHHDLGTAYKEMGLLDEAIEEFQAALRASGHHLPTYELLGQCFMEKGQVAAAVRSLTRALDAPYQVEDELIGIYYHLGRAHQEMGNTDSALEFYDRVFSLDINFADVTERLRDLR